MKRTKFIYLETGEPTEGEFRKDIIIFNADPVEGGNVGWVCITPGIACKNDWKPSTIYTLGQRVKVKNNVYECTSTGTSSTFPPSHTIGISTDGTVSWSYIGVLAIFKAWGEISS